jgi:gluconate 2-dehydrogenase gamma chain|tara:strand:+ start:12535 stop:13104 length:570 start_codon:yes stop_codon:yes gene_type:complete
MQRRDLLKGLAVVLGGAVSQSCSNAVEVPLSQRIAVQGVMTDEQRGAVYRCADLIIPTTDTPGAIEAGVDNFLDYVISVWYQEDEREVFFAGLAQMLAEAQSAYGQPFISLTKPQQVALLKAAEAREPASDALVFVNSGGGFFAKIKELTVTGYYTSKVGATIERKYVPMPGFYDGDYKFSEVGRQWAK